MDAKECPSCCWTNNRSYPASSRCVVKECRSACRLSSGGRPARWRNAVKDRPNGLSVNRPPRSLGHNAGERSAVLNSWRPSLPIALRHKPIRHSDVLLVAPVGGRLLAIRPADWGIRKVSANNRIIH
jgi:hypothetical protein